MIPRDRDGLPAVLISTNNRARIPHVRRPKLLLADQQGNGCRTREVRVDIGVPDVSIRPIERPEERAVHRSLLKKSHLEVSWDQKALTWEIVFNQIRDFVAVDAVAVRNCDQLVADSRLRQSILLQVRWEDDRGILIGLRLLIWHATRLGFDGVLAQRTRFGHQVFHVQGTLSLWALLLALWRDGGVVRQVFLRLPILETMRTVLLPRDLAACI